MATKPKPKNEVIVQKIPTFLMPDTLLILCATDSAATWVQENIGEYGILQEAKVARSFQLMVSPLFDINDVKMYIEDNFNPNFDDFHFNLDDIPEIKF